METILEELQISEVVAETASGADETNASSTAGVDVTEFDSIVAVGIAKDLADDGTVEIRFEEYDGSSWSDNDVYSTATNTSGGDADTVVTLETSVRNLSDDTEQVRAKVWQDDGAIEQIAVLAQGNPARTGYVDNPGVLTYPNSDDEDIWGPF